MGSWKRLQIQGNEDSEATIAALTFRNMIWPQCGKLSRQYATKAIRQDAGPRNGDANTIHWSEAKPR